MAAPDDPGPCGLPLAPPFATSPKKFGRDRSLGSLGGQDSPGEVEFGGDSFRGSQSSLEEDLLESPQNLTSLTEVPRGAQWPRRSVHSEVEAVRAHCHVLNQEVSLEEVTFETLEDKPVAHNHIVLCGLSDNLQKFFVPLRPKWLKAFPLIVILHESPPDAQLWAKIRVFPKLFFVQGSALNPEDLRRVKLQAARKVVLINEPLLRHGTGESQKWPDQGRRAPLGRQNHFQVPRAEANGAARAHRDGNPRPGELFVPVHRAKGVRNLPQVRLPLLPHLH